MGINNSIEQYFVEHDDGEFTLAEPTAPLIGALVNTACQGKSQAFLYCTKPNRVDAHLGEAADSARLAIVGQ